MADALLDALCEWTADPQDHRWRSLVERFVRERLMPEVVRRWRRLRHPPEPEDAERALATLPEACMDLISEQYERLLTQGVPETYRTQAWRQGVPLERFLTKHGWRRCLQQCEQGGSDGDSDAAADDLPEACGPAATAKPDDRRAEAGDALAQLRVRLRPLPAALTKPHLCGGLMLWPRLDVTQPEAQRLLQAVLAAIDAQGGRQAVLAAIAERDAPVAVPGSDAAEAIALAHEYARWLWSRIIEEAWDELRRARAAGDAERLAEAQRRLVRLGREFLIAPLPHAVIAAFFTASDANAYQLVTRYRRLIDQGRFIVEPELLPGTMGQP